MTKILKAICMLIITVSGTCLVRAQNRWNIYAGGDISHLCETPLRGIDKTYGWGGGAFIGGGYEINFNSHWSITPRLEFSFDNNGATLSSENESFFNNHSRWKNYWSASIPVIAYYRFSVADNVRLRIGLGSYIQTIMGGQKYASIYDSDTMMSTDYKESLSGSFNHRLNVGIAGEVAVETGHHLSYMLRAKYPYIKKGWLMNTLTLSIGIGYAF
ncbi:MAG: PorT family protein [Muribaculaceae bacterium]|nr:PorT family protein [Muribaculaceae bacterium]